MPQLPDVEKSVAVTIGFLVSRAITSAGCGQALTFSREWQAFAQA